MLDWNRNLLSFRGVFQEAFHGLGMELEDPLDTVEEPKSNFLRRKTSRHASQSFVRKTGMSFSLSSIGVC